MRRIFAVLVSIGLASVVLVGCASGMSANTPSTSSAAGRHAAPQFVVPNLYGGAPVRLAAYRGRPVLVSFWASWCGQCQAEMPALEKFAASHPGIAVIGIATLDQDGMSRQFAKSVGATYPMGTDTDGALLAKYRGVALPTTAVIDAQGRLVSTIFGGVSASDLAGIARQFGVG